MRAIGNRFTFRAGRLGALVVAAAAVALVLAPGAHGERYFGGGEHFGQMSLSVNPKTRNVRVEARYIRPQCTDGTERTGVNPGPIKARASRSGRFQGSLSENNSFLYIRGRINGRRARGELFFWSPWFETATCSTGAIPWSLPRA